MAANAATPDAALAKLSIEENGKSNGASNGSAAAPNTPEYKEQFKAFSKFGDTKSDGKLITLSQSDKWMKQAKVIDKKITTTDTAIHFKKLKSLKVTFSDYNKFLDDLATTKKVDLAEIKQKLANCGAPGVAQITNVSIAASPNQLTSNSLCLLFDFYVPMSVLLECRVEKRPPLLVD